MRVRQGPEELDVRPNIRDYNLYYRVLRSI